MAVACCGEASWVFPNWEGGWLRSVMGLVEQSSKAMGARGCDCVAGLQGAGCEVMLR